MKIFITSFVLIFSYLAVAEEISDFQIEGMSIGESLTRLLFRRFYFREHKNI